MARRRVFRKREVPVILSHDPGLSNLFWQHRSFGWSWLTVLADSRLEAANKITTTTAYHYGFLLALQHCPLIFEKVPS